MWLINNDFKLIRKLINWYEGVRIEWKNVKWFIYNIIYMILYIIFFILIFIYNFIYFFNNNSFSYKLIISFINHFNQYF